MSKKAVRRRRIGPPAPKFDCSIDPVKPLNNKPPKDWDTQYELVVRFRYGLDEESIAKIAGLRNYDTGISLAGPDAGIRDLQFPCGDTIRLGKAVALIAARRLHHADHFGALTLEISCPVERIGINGFQNWIGWDGKVTKRAKLNRSSAKPTGSQRNR